MQVCSQVNIHGVDLTLHRKAIKNMYLRVYPPDGRVCLSAPLGVPDVVLQTFVAQRLAWLVKQQHLCRTMLQEQPLQLVDGEILQLFGTSYRLQLVERYGRHEIIMDNTSAKLYIRPGTTLANRLKVVQNWYRQGLKQQIKRYLEKWQPILGVEPRYWGIRRMKTRWGSCNPRHKRIWLSLQLASKHVDCLEYVVVHELVHLLERSHNKRFYSLLERFMPDWQSRRHQLNKS